MRFAEALAELDGRQPESMPQPDLSRITAVAELLDDPQLTYPSIHVTGTNGKTTTARVAMQLACAHGLTTGLYTSPHLESVTERLQVCGDLITEEEFGEEYGHLQPILQAVDERGGVTNVTYFEALTALAYLWFADKPVELGVFEVGMGGAWDATNLVAGDVAVVCPISLDHRELGDTVEKVATEKAGIIKPGKIAVVREQAPEALKVIEERCVEYEVTLYLEGREFDLASRTQGVGGQVLGIRTPRGTYDDLLLRIHGAHAGLNAAAAIVAVEAFLDRPLDEDVTREALALAVSPGRLEVVGRHPLVILDGAHNPAAAEALVASLRETFMWERLHLVVGGFTSHDLGTVVATLAPIAGHAYAASNSSPRSRPATEIAGFLVERGVQTEVFPSVADAFGAAREAAGEADLILVTGSLYTVADARRALGDP
ncbi:MAG TPA: folylpolyglutamate synthase/dihydrofolate synthase family protein [Actinomycetota bacterium]|nr:folylpolyglutamate synthase/dihydrofolate synthase family protein [Actinomycetota bacterium]